MKLRVLTPALEEITDSALWYNSQAEGLGREFWNLIDQTLAAIARSPERFAVSEFSTAHIELRYAYIRKFKQVIHFLLEKDQVVVIAVTHAARRPGYWLKRLKDS